MKSRIFGLTMTYIKRLSVLSVIATAVFSCAKDDPQPNPDAAGTDFGKITSAVAIVNPKINEGSTTTIASGTQRQGVSIKAGELAPVATDATGLAVIKSLPAGDVPVLFPNQTINQADRNRSTCVYTI